MDPHATTLLVGHHGARSASGLGIRRLAVEAAELSVGADDDLGGRLPAIEMVGVSHWIEGLRAVKDRDEVAAIREAMVSAERGFGMLRNGLREGESEKDVG